MIGLDYETNLPGRQMNSPRVVFPPELIAALRKARAIAVLSGAGVPGFPPLPEFAALGGPEIERRIAGWQEAFIWWRRPDREAW